MHVRRATVALAAVLAVAVAPLVPAPALAAPPPTPRLLTAAIPTSGTSTTGTAVLTHAVDPGSPFEVAGLAYESAAPADVDLRASADGRTWTPWVHAGGPDGGPDRDSAEAARGSGRYVTGPVWTGTARFVQYRVRADGAVRNLRAQVVDTAGHHESTVDRLRRTLRGLVADGARARPAGAMTDQPAIVSRAEWRAAPPSGTPSYGDVELAVVHHTVNANTYSEAEADDVVRGIQTYHMRSNGWSDIGYNFIVDRFGRVYEGRAGGIDRPVIGAQAEGFNAVSTGAALLGTFGAAAPPDAMLDSLERLLAWRLDVAHVDPTMTATVTSRGSSRHPDGARVLLRTISGHRDLGVTECPGHFAYGTIERLRAGAATIGNPKFFDLAAGAPATGTQRTGYAPTTISARATEELTWNAVVSHPALGEVRHAAIPATTHLAWGWDGRDDAGRGVPGGTYTVTVTGSGAGGAARGGSTTAAVDNTDEPKPATRLAGADRYGTAAAVAMQVAPTPRSDVVIASGESNHLVDSLVAAPLARTKGGPLLLTTGAELPAATVAQIDRLRPTSAWLVGGTAAIGEGVAETLLARGIAVHRIAGADAPSTAAAVARTLGGPKRAAIVVARARANLVDGLAASGPAAGLARPVLLVERDSVPAATTDVLADLGTTEVWAVGGPAAIAEAVVAHLRARRVAGEDRYATAIAIADAAGAAGLAADSLVVSSGATANLVDALSGGALGRAVLLTARAELPAPTWRAVHARRQSLARAFVLGGTAAVADDTVADVRHAMNAL